jgi:hypothetical protein
MRVRGFLVMCGVCVTAGCSLIAPSDRELMGDTADAALDGADSSRDSAQCLAAGSTCEVDTECCGLACNNFVCCLGRGSACRHDSQCCGGSCSSGQCD